MSFVDPEKSVIMLEDSDTVKFIKTGEITEIEYLQKRRTTASVKKLNNDEYVVLSTGEIKTVEHNDSRHGNANGLRKTFKKLRYLINNNFSGKENELFITLTYAENMTDEKRLYKDFDKFIKRFKYKYPGLEYISVIEYQARGALHAHVLIKWPKKKQVFIPNAEIRDLWQHGFVRVERIKGVDNIGAYLTAYLVDIPLEDAKNPNGEVIEKTVKGVQKKYIKGGRLKFYPPGMNYYRYSRGIKRPEPKLMKWKEAKKNVQQSSQTYERDSFIEVDGFNNAIKNIQFNNLRK